MANIFALFFFFFFKGSVSLLLHPVEHSWAPQIVVWCTQEVLAESGRCLSLALLEGFMSPLHTQMGTVGQGEAASLRVSSLGALSRCGSRWSSLPVPEALPWGIRWERDRAKIPHSHSAGFLLSVLLAVLWVPLLVMLETFVWRICQWVVVN